VRVLVAALLVWQGAAVSPPPSPAAERNALRAGLDTLYSGDFAAAAAYFARLAGNQPADPAPVVFQAGAYIWWAAARDSADFELQRIDSLLGLALARARAAPQADFWFATALGYRARQREEHGHAFGAAKDAKAMRDIYRRILAADSSCADCYLGLGVYEYGLARASALARLFAKIIGLGSGNAERGIRYMRRVAHDGDLARVEGTWVLAAALVREAARDPEGGPVLEREARGYVQELATRYPGNPLFQRFLRAVSSGRLPQEAVGATAGAAPAAAPLTAVRGRQRGELPEHVMDMTLDRVRGDVEPLGDLFVAEPGRDQVLDLLLALGEADGAGAGLRARDPDAARDVADGRPRLGGWRQVGPGHHGANRFHEVIGRRIFHDEAVGAAFDELMHILLGRNEIHHDSFGVGGDALQIREEGMTVAVRERGVEEHDVRLRVAQLLHSGLRVFDCRHHLDVGVRREQARQSVAHQPVVLDDEHSRARRGRGPLLRDTAIRAAPVFRAVAFRQPIIQSASPLRRHPALYTANCPRHVEPPLLSGNLETTFAPRQRS
jgi:hypothetical protein